MVIYKHLSPTKYHPNRRSHRIILSVTTAKLIYYEAIGRASTLSRLSMKIFISKWSSGHLGTRKVVQHNKYRLDGSCPFCLAPNEDTAHIMDCQHEDAQGIWKKHLLTSVCTLHKNKFPVTFIIAIKQELTAWRFRGIPPLLSIYPEPMRTMIQEQERNIVGWNQFLLVFLPSSWKNHLLQILREKHLLIRYSPALWASKIIRATWQFIHDTWEDRCHKLHETDLIHELSGKQQLILSVKAELAIGLHNLPACDFSRLFSIPNFTDLTILNADTTDYIFAVHIPGTRMLKICYGLGSGAPFGGLIGSSINN